MSFTRDVILRWSERQREAERIRLRLRSWSQQETRERTLQIIDGAVAATGAALGIAFPRAGKALFTDPVGASGCAVWIHVEELLWRFERDPDAEISRDWLLTSPTGLQVGCKLYFPCRESGCGRPTDRGVALPLPISLDNYGEASPEPERAEAFRLEVGEFLSLAPAVCDRDHRTRSPAEASRMRGLTAMEWLVRHAGYAEPERTAEKVAVR